MKLIPAIFLILTFNVLNAQDKPTEWFTGDISAYETFYKVQDLDRAFLDAIDRKSQEITNSKRRFRKGCVGNGKSVRLNWMAKDKENHQIISLSYGGRAYYTAYYFVDYTSGDIQIQMIRIKSSDRELSYVQAIELINKGEFEKK